MQSVLQKILQKNLQSESANPVWAGPTSLPCNILVYVRNGLAMEEIVAARRSLAADVENNRVGDTDAGDRVCALGDRIHNRAYNSDSAICRAAICRPIDLT